MTRPIGIIILVLLSN